MARKQKTKLDATSAMLLFLRAERLPAPEPEHRFHPERLWRFYLSWPLLKMALEVEGITYYGKNKDGSMRLGRHQTAKGYAEDCMKYAEAQRLGWQVWRFTPDQICAGLAFPYIETELRKREARARELERLAARSSAR